MGNDGGTLNHTPTSIRYLQPKNTSFDYNSAYANYKQIQHCGNFSAFSIQSGLQFAAEVELTDASEVEAGNKLAAALKGQSSTMFVKSNKFSDYGPRDRWRGPQALKGEGLTATSILPSVLQTHIRVKLFLLLLPKIDTKSSLLFTFLGAGFTSSS